jgi:hypothetical protein
MISILLSNFDLTIQAFAAIYLLIATEYIIVSPDFFSALAFVSFLTYAYSAANQSVNKSLSDAEQASNKELTSVISAKSARLSEKLAVLEVEQEYLLALSQSAGKFQSVQTSSVSYTDTLLQDALYSSVSLSHVSAVTRHVGGLYSSLMDSSMFGSRGYYTLAKSSLASSIKNVSRISSHKAKSFTASIVNKRSGSSDSVITVNALRLGASSKKLALVGAAASIRKGKSTRSKKETFISKIATKLTSRSSLEQEETSKKLNPSKGKKK